MTRITRPIRRPVALAATATAFVVALAGCGSDGDADADGGVQVDVAAAEQIIAPYLGQPSAFPVDEPLDELPPAGTKLVLVHAGTPAGNLFFDLMKPAAEAMGAELSVVVAGTTAQDVSSAMDSVVEMKPDGVIDIAVDPAFFPRQLEALRDAGSVVVGVGMSNGEEYGFDTVQYGPTQSELVGRVMAAWALSETKGEKSEFAVYTVPELSFLDPMVESAQATFAELCDGCEIRVVDVPAAQLGNTAAQTVVADLQAHPDTGYALFANDEMQTGLPAAMKVAGIDVPTVGDGPLPVQLQSIQDGDQEAGLGTDIQLFSWTAIDQVAREMAGQPLSGPAANGLGAKQILRQEDLEGADMSAGWTAYPDFQERFEQLWGLS